MARRKSGSPTIEIPVTEEARERARQSDSGGCLIADYIKTLGYTGVSVDMATIRFTDRASGLRFTYLTPEEAQYILLAFDQGWPSPFDRFTLRRAVKVTPVIAGKLGSEKREARLRELLAKKASGEQLSARETRSLAALKNPSRPQSYGPSRVKADGTVVGGHPLKLATNPNLLRGRKRIFGAKVAKPGQVFQNAVDAAVEKRIRDEASEPV